MDSPWRYDRMGEREDCLAAEVADMKGEAEDVDFQEGATRGVDSRGNDKDDLEQRARDQAAQKTRTTANDAGHIGDVAESVARLRPRPPETESAA